jgi:hypothetical protein
MNEIFQLQGPCLKILKKKKKKKKQRDRENHEWCGMKSSCELKYLKFKKLFVTS